MALTCWWTGLSDTPRVCLHSSITVTDNFHQSAADIRVSIQRCSQIVADYIYPIIRCRGTFSFMDKFHVGKFLHDLLVDRKIERQRKK